ncbi:DUF6349 family protein [Leucobacter sp. NPDC077196]|uniref:DUF6349 family protein n=1 Tax=Leucobacter sp. NPDC077196 TaxID=3154959 RepID=UPI00341D5896
MSTAQLSFDIDALIHQAAVETVPTWDGAPLRYHEQYRTPAELDAAWERWQFENGSFGCVPYSHMWHSDKYRRGEEISIGAHQHASFQADARCDGGRFGGPEHDHADGELPNDLIYQFICSPCRWHTISNSENAAVEAWHDHVLPGWRDLPVVPKKLAEHGGERTKLARLQSWLEEYYPAAWQASGFPIISERNTYGTRHVPGGSPWGGYNLSDSVLRPGND